MSPGLKGPPQGAGEGCGEWGPTHAPKPTAQALRGTFPDSRDALLTWADMSPGAGVLTRTHRLLGTVGPDPRVTEIAEPVSTGNS